MDIIILRGSCLKGRELLAKVETADNFIIVFTAYNEITQFLYKIKMTMIAQNNVVFPDFYNKHPDWPCNSDRRGIGHF